MCHINVIRLHAISSSLGVEAYLQQGGNGGGCYHDGYFLVLEKLTHTLTTRLQEWQGRHTQLYTAYNRVILVTQQQQQKQQEREQGSSSVTTPPPAVPFWKKRILSNTLRTSGTQSLSVVSSSTSSDQDVSISSIDSSTGAASYFTSDYFADDDVSSEIIDANAKTNANTNADADVVENCGADDDCNTTTITLTNDIAQLLEERVEAALQLAEAIQYLSSQQIMHRDLKPDNIGFDAQGVLKVFDFDIARRCCHHPRVPPPVVRPTSPTRNGSSNNNSSSNNNKIILNDIDTENHTFQYTHRVGSPRYMSPECAKGEKYNQKTDVYSFALLLHQVLTLQKPYDDLEDDEHDQLVFYQGVRPMIPVDLPKNIQQLLTHSWSPHIATRPTMHTICHMVQEERKELLRLGTPPSLVVVPSSSSLSVVSSMSYVSSCSFTAVSDINVSITNKKKKKKKEKKNTLFNSKSNINSHTTSSSSSNKNKNNNNGSKKKNKGNRQRRRFLRPSRLTLFKRNSGGPTNDPNKNSVVVPAVGPTKKSLHNKLSSSSSCSSYHPPPRRRIGRTNSNTTNAKAA